MDLRGETDPICIHQFSNLLERKIFVWTMMKTVFISFNYQIIRSFSRNTETFPHMSPSVTTPQAFDLTCSFCTMLTGWKIRWFESDSTVQMKVLCHAGLQRPLLVVSECAPLLMLKIVLGPTGLLLSCYAVVCGADMVASLCTFPATHHLWHSDRWNCSDGWQPDPSMPSNEIWQREVTKLEFGH